MGNIQGRLTAKEADYRSEVSVSVSALRGQVRTRGFGFHIVIRQGSTCHLASDGSRDYTEHSTK